MDLDRTALLQKFMRGRECLRDITSYIYLSGCPVSVGSDVSDVSDVNMHAVQAGSLSGRWDFFLSFDSFSIP